MRVLILHNLSSGYGDGAIYDFIRSVSAHKDEVVLRCVGAEDSFDEALRDATSFDVVVASGGDGTVASVCYHLRNTQVPILPFPAGTANLIAQNIALPFEPAALAQLIYTGQTVDFDLGEITAGKKRHGFLMIAGCGLDALIMNGAKPHKRMFGPMAYVKAALDNVMPTKSNFQLEVDGIPISAEGVGVLLVNFSKIQFDIPLAAQNRPRDGMLDVVVLATKTAFDLIPALASAAIDHTGTLYSQAPGLAFYRGRDIKICADPALPVQFDGEVVEARTPLYARVLPEACRLIVSESAYREFGE